MQITAIDLALVVGAYLIGSIPFALIITRWRRQADVRQRGSGHAGATNVLRIAGVGWALIVLLWDIGKGFLVVQIAGQIGSPWVVPVSAMAVVIGHCWPLFADFRGGMGVAASGGALLGAWPLGFVLGVGMVAALTLALRHTARANLFTGLFIWLMLLIFGAPPQAIFVGAGVGVVVAYRSFSDWNREYRELWLDREEQSEE